MFCAVGRPHFLSIRLQPTTITGVKKQSALPESESESESDFDSDPETDSKRVSGYDADFYSDATADSKSASKQDNKTGKEQYCNTSIPGILI